MQYCTRLVNLPKCKKLWGARDSELCQFMGAVGPQTGVGVAAHRFYKGKVRTERARTRLVERNDESVFGSHVAFDHHRVREVVRVGPALPLGGRVGGKALEDLQTSTVERRARLTTPVEPPQRQSERADEGLPRAPATTSRERVLWT